jgi:hypothetical protein
VTPEPIQKPHPPIWLGGFTPAALRRAVRYGDGFTVPGANREVYDHSPSMRIGGYALEQAAGGRFKPAQRPLLHAIGQRPNLQVAAEPCRRLGQIESPPARLQLFDIKRLEPAIWPASFARSRSGNDRLIDCPPPSQADRHMALLRAES